jgi:hypothetical protein
MDPFALEEQRLAKRRRIFALVIVGVVILFLLNWLSGFSFIEVTVSGQGGGDLEYSILDQKQPDKRTVINTSTTTVKKLARKGNFEVIVRQSDRTAFAVASAKGFFRTTKINLELQKERGREFIGNNPSPCMTMLKQVLVSYACGGPYSDTIRHIPASGNQATYNLLAASGREGLIEGFVHMNGQDFVVLKNIIETSEQNPSHAVYPVGDDLSLPLIGTALSGLNSNDIYSIVPFRQGFLAHNTTLTHFAYFSSIDGEPEIIQIERPEDQTLEPYLIAASGETIAVAYAKPLERGRVDLDDPKTAARTPSTITLRTGNNVKQLMFNKRYGSMQICGADRLCMLSGKLLEVYDVSGKKPAKLFEVTNVSEILYTGKLLLVIKDEGVVGLNTSTASGSMQYTFGQHTYCGIGLSGDDYLLCVINPKQKKAALLVSQNKESDGIDQKIAGLLQLGEIRDISVYKNAIFISPNAGEISFQPSLGGYDYNPDVVASVSDRIDAKVDELGIDRNKYRVVNTLR